MEAKTHRFLHDQVHDARATSQYAVWKSWLRTWETIARLPVTYDRGATTVAYGD